MQIQNFFNKNHYFLAMFIRALSFILKSSPQFLLVKEKIASQTRFQNFYLLSLLNGSEQFYVIVSGLISILCVFCIFSILVWKRGMLCLQIIQNILFPIQIYLNLCFLNLTIYTVNQLVFICVSFTYFFDFRDQYNSLLIVKSFVRQYPDLWNLIMILSAGLSFFYNANYNAEILLVICSLVLIKSFILLYRIQYESPLIQYTAYLCQIHSWLSVGTLLVYEYADIDTTAILWIYSIFIVACLLYQNPIVTRTLQTKYIRCLKHKFYAKLILTKDQRSIEKQQSQLIISLCLVNYVLQIRDENSQPTYFLNLSESFKHQICTFIRNVQNSALKAESPDQVYETPKFRPEQKKISAKGIQEQIFHLVNDRQLRLQNKFQYCQRFWSIVKSLKQISDVKFQNLRRFVCYTIPQINNTFQARIIYLYYLSYQYDKHPDNKQRMDERNSFFSNLHKEIDYDFVMAKTKNKLLCSYFIGNTSKYINSPKTAFGNQTQFCLQRQTMYGSNDYEAFYKQTICQENLQNLFKKFIALQKSMINKMQMPFQGQDINKLVCERNKVKKDLGDVVDETKVLNSAKYAIHQYIIDRYISMTPLIAAEKLKQAQQIRQDKLINQGRQNQCISSDNRFKNRHQEKKGRAMFMISGIRNRGNIIYGCNTFKELMQIKADLDLTASTPNQSINFVHIMLPCWIDKHQVIMNECTVYEKQFAHLGKKYHLKSLISKKIYQVEFKINIITCNMQDLIMAIDMTFRKVDFLSIYKGQKKVFLRDQGQMDSQPKANIQNYTQTIFGQQHQIRIKYSDNDQDEQADTETLLQTNKEQQRFKSSVCTLGNSKEQKSVDAERKLVHYRQNKFFLKNYFISFLIIQLLVPPILFFIIFLFQEFIEKEKEITKDYFSFKLLIQNQFLLTDLKSSNSFFMMSAPTSPYVNFRSEEKKAQLKNVWYLILKEQINSLRMRGNKLSKNLTQGEGVKQLVFSRPSQDADSFLYSQQKFDVQYFNVLKDLNLQDTVLKNMTYLPHTGIVLNGAQKISQNDFYAKSLNRYDHFLQPKGIFDKLENYYTKTTQQQIRMLNGMYVIISALCLSGAAIYAFIYLRIKKKVYGFISIILNFPQKSLVRMRITNGNLKDFIQQSNILSNQTVYKTIQSSQGFCLNRNKATFIGSRMKGAKDGHYKKTSIFKQHWPEVLFLTIVVLGFMATLQGNNQEAINQIKQIDNYLQGTHKLVLLSSKSIFVFTQLIDAIITTDRLLNPRIPAIINQIKNINRLQILKLIQPNINDLEKSLFMPWCKIDYLKINCYDQSLAEQSFMQAFSKSIKIYEQVYHKLLQSQGVVIDSSFVFMMYKQLSHSIQMVRQLLRKAQQSYLGNSKDLSIFILYNGIWVLLFCVVAYPWAYFQVYSKNRIYYQEILSLMTFQQMENILELTYYLNQSQRQSLFKKY